MLTIAIPTFNRHEKLLSTLKKLYLLKGDLSIKIIIIDNFSTPPISEFLIEKQYSGFAYTQIFRNNGNIGLGANLLMCFVYTTSEWMWLLGDDDLPLSTCLNSILAEIQKAEINDFLIKFNSSAGDFPNENTTVSNEEEFIKFCSNFRYYSNMLFISNSIFRVQAMQTHLRIMFEYTNTMAPHIIGILENVTKEKQIKIVNKFLTEHGQAIGEDSWDIHRVRIGVLNFSDFKDHSDFKSEMLRKLYINYFAPTRFYANLFVYPFRNKDYSIDYWRWFYWKSAFLFTGIKSTYLLILAGTIRYYFNFKIINTLITKRVKSHTHNNEGRC